MDENNITSGNESALEFGFVSLCKCDSNLALVK